MAQDSGQPQSNLNAEARAALRAARGALEWSRPVAADKAGVHRNTILSWEGSDETWGPRLNYLKVLLHEGSATARASILRLLDLQEGDLEEMDEEYADLFRRVYERREEPAVQQTLDLLRTLVGDQRHETKAASA